jgi:hypothetical protein
VEQGAGWRGESGFELLAAAAFTIARTGLCVYRAATQSLVHDEAFFFEHFVDGPWARLWSLYDASNHVLYTVLARLSVRIFGLSEFTLRLPSVLAGLILTIALFQTLRSCRSTALRWTVFIALGLHPLLLDFSVVARGYGLSIALLVLAILFTMRKRPVLAGSLAGLAVCANLTTAVPAAALAGACFVLTEGPPGKRLRQLFAMAVPGLLVILAICYLPLRTARMSHFYVGFDSLRDSLLRMVFTSIRVAERGGLMGQVRLGPALAFILLPAVAAIWTVAGIRFWRRGAQGRERLVPPATLAFSAMLLLAAHMLLGLKYPIDRTGLYLVALGGLSWCLVADASGSRVLRAAGVLIASLLAVQFASLLQWREFEPWWYDAAVKDAAVRLAQECNNKPEASVSADIDQLHEPAMEFYRKYYKMAALKPLVGHATVTFTGYDYYVFNRVDALAEKAAGREVLYTDRTSGIILAK